ncbi:MAG: hypothetical protein QOH10_1188 [Actinomycetota bacterium]|nr:hypothetical protein [Actinomycetota bacterium]
MLAIALVASILWTWPLVLHLAKGGRSPLDSPFEAWTIDWVQYAIRHPRHLYDADIFAPTRGTLAFSAPLIGVALPTLPLRWLGMSPMAIYNASQILATSFSAAGAYLLGRVVLRRRAAAAVVGFAFAFGPVPYAVSLQLQATARAGVPLAAAATWWLADRAESNRSLYPPAIALALVLAWQTSVSLYPATYAVVAMLVVLVVRWRVVRRRGVIAAALAGLGAVFVCAIPQLVFAHAYRDAAPKEPGDYGASFVQAAPRLWYPKLLDWKGPAVLIVSAGFPGITLLAMAVVGAVLMPRTRVRTLGLVATAVGAVMALGAAAHGWRRFTPYRLVLLVVPLAGALREYARAWTLGLLGLGVLAGGALLRLEQRSKRIASLVAAAVCVCIALEGFAPWTDVTPVSIHPVDVALSKLPGSGGVLYLPIASTRRAAPDLSFFVQPDIVFRTTAHHRPTVNGYSAYFPPWSGTAVDLAAKLRCASARRALYEAGVRFVVSAPYLPISAVGLRQLGRYGNEVLYELLAPSRRHASC